MPTIDPGEKNQDDLEVNQTPEGQPSDDNKDETEQRLSEEEVSQEPEQFNDTASGVAQHQHDGEDIQPVNFSQLTGLIETVTSVPSHTPTSISEQIKLYDDNGTWTLYVYDSRNNLWRKFT